MTVSERLALQKAYNTVNKEVKPINEWIEDPYKEIKDKMAAHGYEYNDIDSDDERGYIVFNSSNGIFPSGGFKSWEEVSDWVNNVEFDESYNYTGVTEADSFGRPDDLFAKLASLQSHKYDRPAKPTRDELHAQALADYEKAKASGKFHKLNSERADRAEDSKYETVLVIPNWMVNRNRTTDGINIEQYVGPSRMDSKKLEMAGAFEKGDSKGFSYTNGYVVLVRYLIRNWLIEGVTEDGGVKVRIKYNRNPKFPKTKFFEKVFGLANRGDGKMQISYLGWNSGREYISSEELISRVDDYISAVKQYGGIENYKKLGEELRMAKMATSTALKDELAQKIADKEEFDKERYGDVNGGAKDATDHTATDESTDIGRGNAEIFDIEWYPENRDGLIADFGELPDYIAVKDIDAGVSEDEIKKQLDKYLIDNYGCLPASYDWDVTEYALRSDNPEEEDEYRGVYESFLSQLESTFNTITEASSDEKTNVIAMLQKLKNDVKDPKDVQAFLDKYSDRITEIEHGIDNHEEKSVFRKMIDFVGTGLKKGGEFIKKHWGKILIALACILMYMFWPQLSSSARHIAGGWFGGKGNGEGIPADDKSAVDVVTGTSGGTDPNQPDHSRNVTTIDVTGYGNGSSGETVGDDGYIGDVEMVPDASGTAGYYLPPELRGEVDWSKPVRTSKPWQDAPDGEYQIDGYYDKQGNWKTVDWDKYLGAEEGAEESVASVKEADESNDKTDEEFPKPCEKLYSLKTVKAAQNHIRSVVDPYVRGLFSDEDWSNIHNVFKVMRENLGMNVNWGVRDDNYYSSGYSPDGKSKVYQFDAKYTNYLGRKITINGQIVAAAAGTVEMPMSKYDITFILF